MVVANKVADVGDVVSDLTQRGILWDDLGNAIVIADVLAGSEVGGKVDYCLISWSGHDFNIGRWAYP